MEKEERAEQQGDAGQSSSRGHILQWLSQLIEPMRLQRKQIKLLSTGMGWLCQGLDVLKMAMHLGWHDVVLYDSFGAAYQSK